MRFFTPEEKELIVNTPITLECFDLWEDYHYEQLRLGNFSYPGAKWKKCTVYLYPTTLFETTARDCEILRLKYLETKNEHYFDILVHQLPASYKVVRL